MLEDIIDLPWFHVSNTGTKIPAAPGLIISNAPFSKESASLQIALTQTLNASLAAVTKRPKITVLKRDGILFLSHRKTQVSIPGLVCLHNGVSHQASFISGSTMHRLRLPRWFSW